MLQWIRNIGKSTVGKIFTTLLFSIIIFGFVIFGVSDIFRGKTPTTVVTVGKTEIDRFAFQSAIENFMRQRAAMRDPVTFTELKKQGYDTLILNQLVDEALIGETIRSLELGAPVTTIRNYIANLPMFQTDGVFDINLYQSALLSSGETEAAFIQRLKEDLPRQQLLSVIIPRTPISDTKASLFWRLSHEKRTLQALIIPYTSFTAPEIDENSLKSFYETRKKDYLADEQRDISILILDPSEMKKKISISNERLQKEYEISKENLMKKEGRRIVDQLIFSSAEKAKEASQKLKDGVSFDDVVKEFDGKDGTVFKEGTSPFARDILEQLDSNLAKIIFDMDANIPSEAIQTKFFGSIIARVKEILPPEIPTFENVREEIEQKLISAKIQEDIETLQSKIEDRRGEQKPISEIAQEFNLQTVPLTSVNEKGLSPDQQNIAEAYTKLVPDLLKRAFEINVGEDAGMFSTSSGGYLWFDVTRIAPSHQMTFEEIKDKLTEEWKQDALKKQARDKAQSIIEQLKSGISFEEIAKKENISIKVIEDLTRNDSTLDLPPSSVKDIFLVKTGDNGRTETDQAVIVYHILKSEVPHYNSQDDGVLYKKSELAVNQGKDFYEAFLKELRKEIPVKIEKTLYDQVFGGEQ